MNAPVPSPDKLDPAPTLIALAGDEVVALEESAPPETSDKAEDAPDAAEDALLAELEVELAAVGEETEEPVTEAKADDASPKVEEGPVVQPAVESTEFTGLVRDAIERFDGQILFELDHDPNFGHVAAVQMGEGNERQFAIVIKPDNGGPLRVEPAAESEHPLAAIMQSYAGLVEAWKKAA